jgi:hypothetical protein
MTALKGVHVLKSVMELDVGGVFWSFAFNPTVLPSYPFYKFHPIPSPHTDNFSIIKIKKISHFVQKTRCFCFAVLI